MENGEGAALSKSPQESKAPAREKKPRKSAKGGAEADEPVAKKSKTATFAGRYCPEEGVRKARFEAIKHVFEEKVAPLVRRQSSLQERLG